MSRRLAGTHLAGLWEFPGGKLDPGETPDAGLRRELLEELGVRSTVGPKLLSTEHAYPTRTIRLHFYRCDLLGEPAPRLGQELRWVAPDELRELDVPEADRDLVALLLGEADASARPPA